MNASHTYLFLLFFFLILCVALIAYFILQSPEEISETPKEETPLTHKEPSSSVLATANQLQQESANQSAQETYVATVEAGLTGRTVEDGILLCSINKENAYKAYCLTELAHEQREGAYCDVISGIDERDACYLTLVFDGEDQYCARLTLEENIEVCRILLGE